jgi:hypothetical protein
VCTCLCVARMCVSAHVCAHLCVFVQVCEHVCACLNVKVDLCASMCTCECEFVLKIIVRFYACVCNHRGQAKCLE